MDVPNGTGSQMCCQGTILPDSGVVRVHAGAHYSDMYMVWPSAMIINNGFITEGFYLKSVKYGYILTVLRVLLTVLWQ